MAEPVFEVELLHEADTGKHPVVSLALPATPWELLDAMDALRLSDGDSMIVDIIDYHGFDFLEEHLDSRENLCALNALAQKLSGWTEVQREAYRGMVAIEKLGEDHCLPTLINIAYSEDSYNVAYEAVNDEQLGRFYVDGGFVPETDELTDEQCELLDYAKIGKKMRTGENGTFTRIGYVVKTGELEEAYSALDLKLRRPDYDILLKLTASDSERSTMLRLPTSRTEVENVLRELGADSWQDVSYTCEDCRVPALKNAINETSVLRTIADRAARVFNRMTDQEMTRYKTLLAARGFDSLEDALDAADTLDEYVFSTGNSSFEDIGQREILRSADGEAAKALLPFVNLSDYGKAVAQRDNLILTDYGGIERRDGQPIQVRTILKQQMGGMTLG